ncbi:hypothetical protein [Streptomyces sp. NPDC001876]
MPLAAQRWSASDPGISNMIQVLTGLIESEEFTQILHRLDV